jgi:hypothetical protein
MGLQGICWREIFGVDLRSLALFRMGLAACVLADLAARAPDLVALYGDAGVLPRELLQARYGSAVYLSAHYWAGSDPALQVALLAASAAAALLLAVGRFTWLANLACWYLVSSLQLRNPLVFIAGDTILRLLLFWGLFLPLGARLSLDAARPGAREQPHAFASGASAALLIQVALIYWVTGLQKSGGLWWSGQAVDYALRAEEWATPFGVWLRGQPAALVALDWATLALEILGPFLAFVPGRRGISRLAAVALFWSFHLGLAACMDIGLFPLFSMVAWLPFLPARIWGDGEVEPAPTERDARARAASIAALAVLAYVLVFLSEQLGAPRLVPGPLRAFGRALRLEQSWTMFAPDPPRFTRRFELEAHLENGAVLRVPFRSGLRWLLYAWRSSDAQPDPHAYLQALLAWECKHWPRPASAAGARAVRIALRRRIRSLDRANPAAEDQPIAYAACPASGGG